MTSYLFPENAFSGGGVSYPSLLKRQPLQIGLAEREITAFHSGESVILDFGEELNGGIRILTYHAANVSLRIRFGESLSETCAELGGETNATNDHALRDFTVELQHYSDMTFGQTGFRFVRLDFGGEAKIKCVVAAAQTVKRSALYTYEGEDERIRQIYQAAKRTVDLCSSGGYVWDGVKRDRLVWIGDMAPEVLALTTLYGRMPCIERSLDFVRDQTPLPGWMNGYPMYSMWWIVILQIYGERADARAYIKKQMPYLSSLVRQMDACVGEDGELHYPSYFVDWPTSGRPEEKDGARAINILAVKAAIALLEDFGEDSTVARTLLDKLLKKEIVARGNKKVLALKHFAVGLSQEEQICLVQGGARGMSTFMSYYILKAVAAFDKAAAVDMMKQYYGGMLDKGATTFWEDFDVEWTQGSGRIDAFPQRGEADIHADFGAYCYKGFRHSLCHGWAAGVIAFMKEEGI